MGDSAGVFGDWNPNPSPRTFFSNFLNEDFGTRSFSELLGENGRDAPACETDEKKPITTNKEENGGVGMQLSGDTFKLNPLGAKKPSSRGGLAERIAERAGFNAPKLNTANIRSENLTSSSSEMMSPLLTIPPGLSPTSFLESPVFLSNSMAQPSPTTGKILFGQSNNTYSGSGLHNETKEHLFEDMAPEAFAFKPHPELRSFYFPSGEYKDVSTMNRQPQLPNMQVSVQPEHPVRAGNIESGPMNFQNKQNFNPQAGFPNSSEKKDNGDNITISQRMSDSFTGKEESPSLDDQADAEADPRGEISSVACSAPAEDGYNWRKYGQKQVKGSEFPRSYYKCTHPSCPVKKKVERNHEGHITEIIYKGAHSHPKPPPNRRSGLCHPFSDPQFDGSEHPGFQAGSDVKPLLAITQNGWSDGLEQTSSASGAAEFCDKSTSVRTRFESSDAIDVSSTQSNDEEEDRATHGSVSLGGDGEGDETESKRRKLDICTVEMSAASRAVREPRVVVQTTSEVDILDDGYRWRKYGQKVVKGNPNPRSYYKCTNTGCMVRKHVERASHDLKSVITTYEGKHNHDVPAARNSANHSNSLASSATGTSFPQARGLHGRPERAQHSYGPLTSFGLPGRDHQMDPSSFGYGMPQQGLAGLNIAGLSSMAQMKMPSLPPMHSYMGMRQDQGRFMMPKGEPKEEPSQDSGINMSRATAVYHQMMGRLPLGPQL